MPEGDHLFLAARVRMLGRSLEAVRDSLHQVERARSVMRDLLPDILTDTYEKLDAVEDAAKEIRRAVGLNPVLQRPVTAQTKIIADRVEAIRMHLIDVRDGARAIGTLPGETEKALQADFIDAVENQIKEANTLLRQVTDAATPAEIRRAWQVERALFDESQQFFAEYVELLTGLALRDSGFDEGISDIADRLYRNGYVGWFSLTIPAHKPPNTLTRSRFIHLAFPEWTPWALPLAAFDVGRLELNKAGRSAFVKTRIDAGFRHTDVEKGMADMIATYLFGPAYAWATVIQFDPGAGFLERRTASRRVQAILATLRSLDDPETSTDQTFQNIADELLDQWEAALAEAGETVPTADESAEVGPEIDATETDSWVDELKAAYRPRAMKNEDWEDVADLAAALRDKKEIAPPDDLRAILNAAWKVRIEERYDRSGDDTLTELSERVTTLLRAAAGSPEQGGGLGGLRPPPVAGDRP